MTDGMRHLPCGQAVNSNSQASDRGTDRRGAQASDHPQRGTRSVLIVRGAA